MANGDQTLSELGELQAGQERDPSLAGMSSAMLLLGALGRQALPQLQEMRNQQVDLAARDAEREFQLSRDRIGLLEQRRKEKVAAGEAEKGRAFTAEENARDRQIQTLRLELDAATAAMKSMELRLKQAAADPDSPMNLQVRLENAKKQLDDRRNEIETNLRELERIRSQGGGRAGAGGPRFGTISTRFTPDQFSMARRVQQLQQEGIDPFSVEGEKKLIELEGAEFAQRLRRDTKIVKQIMEEEGIGGQAAPQVMSNEEFFKAVDSAWRADPTVQRIFKEFPELDTGDLLDPALTTPIAGVTPEQDILLKEAGLIASTFSSEPGSVVGYEDLRKMTAVMDAFIEAGEGEVFEREVLDPLVNTYVANGFPREDAERHVANILFDVATGELAGDGVELNMPPIGEAASTGLKRETSVEMRLIRQRIRDLQTQLNIAGNEAERDKILKKLVKARERLMGIIRGGEALPDVQPTPEPGKKRLSVGEAIGLGITSIPGFRTLNREFMRESQGRK